MEDTNEYENEYENENEGSRDDNNRENTETIEENTKLEGYMNSVRKIIKEAKHNELMYPELTRITTRRDLYTWLNNHYMCFYKVFQTDLLNIMHKLVIEQMNE